MPQERRGAIAEIARRHGLHIIEDDIAARCMEDPPQPIAVMAPEFTIYLTSLSKTVAPGLRIGFLHSPEELLERQASIVGASAWMAPPLTAELATSWIEDGTAERILDWGERNRAHVWHWLGINYRGNASPPRPAAIIFGSLCRSPGERRISQLRPSAEALSSHLRKFCRLRCRRPACSASLHRHAALSQSIVIGARYLGRYPQSKRVQRRRDSLKRYFPTAISSHPISVTCALSPGSSNTVVVSASTMAGPAIDCPAFKSAKA